MNSMTILPENPGDHVHNTSREPRTMKGWEKAIMWQNAYIYTHIPTHIKYIHLFEGKLPPSRIRDQRMMKKTLKKLVLSIIPCINRSGVICPEGIKFEEVSY